MTTLPDDVRADDRAGVVLARLGHVMNVRIRQALAESGLSPRHGAALLRLGRCGATSQQDLIEGLAVDASALVAILNDLERDGLVERTRDPLDRRRHIVTVTDAGQQAITGVQTVMSAVEADAFADLSEPEVEQLRALLARVRTRAADLKVCDPS